jgi:hemoglobin-like flavoprotein
MMPSLRQIDEVRHTWESVCERRHRKDHPSVSAAHAFGLVFYNVLFEMDPSLKIKLGNVIRQARVLAEIMSYLTRSPSIKGEAGSLKDLNAVHRSNSKKETSSIHSGTATTDHQHHHEEDDDDHQHLCAVHAAAAAAAATSNAYAELEHRPHRFSNSEYHPVPIPPPSPTSFTYSPSTNKQFDDNVCPFHQQEQEEKYQQQLLHQQQHQEELEKQRHSIQQDLQSQMERKLALQQQEENKWFAYKLREVGIKYVEEYDLVPENLDVFGPALIAALKSRLQDEFSPQMEQAWRKVTRDLSKSTMRTN